MKIHLIDGAYELFRNHFGAPPAAVCQSRPRHAASSAHCLCQRPHLLSVCSYGQMRNNFHLHAEFRTNQDRSDDERLIAIVIRSIDHCQRLDSFILNTTRLILQFYLYRFLIALPVCGPPQLILHDMT